MLIPIAFIVYSFSATLHMRLLLQVSEVSKLVLCQGCILECRRDAQEEGMEDWDQDKLEDVVKQKHGAEKPSNKTDIICKFFLDAVENKLYGW